MYYDVWRTIIKSLKAAAVVGATAAVAHLLGDEAFVEALKQFPWGLLIIFFLTAVVDYLKHRNG